MRLSSLFDEKGGEYMLNMLLKTDPETAAKLHINDRSRIIRALEVYRLTGKTMTEQKLLSKTEESLYEPFYIGINYRDRAVLYDRINRRVDIMLENGLLDEAREFCSLNPDSTACQAIGYKELTPYFKGEKGLLECVEKLKTETRHYAKRQLTWFRKNERINWIYPDDYNSPEELYSAAFASAEDFLRRYRNEKAE